MTCIAAMVKDGQAAIAGDGKISFNYLTEGMRTPKVFAKSFNSGTQSALLGFASSLRVGQLIRYHVDLPDFPPMMDSHFYMAHEVIPQMRALLKTDGAVDYKDGESMKNGANGIIVIRKAVFQINADFSFYECEAGFTAIGNGAEVAFGSMLRTQVDPRFNAHDAVYTAVSDATRYVDGVGGLITVLETPKS